MKKLFSIFLSAVIVAATVLCMPVTQAIAAEPVLSYDFEASPQGLTLHNADIIYDNVKKSHVLSLSGKNSYAEFEQGFFDNRNVMTISMDVLSKMSSENFFTFAYGSDNKAYSFLRVRGTTVNNAITSSGNLNEVGVFRDFTKPFVWHNITLVIDNTTTKMYVDGELTTFNQTAETGVLTSDLGKNLIAYLGKSFFEDDKYFEGSFDNFRVYEYALSQDEVVSAIADNIFIANSVTIGTLNADAGIQIPWEYKLEGTDDHTAVTADIDHANGQITSYIRKGTNLSSVPVTFSSALINDAVITVDGMRFNNGDCLNLNYDRQVQITYNNRVENYTLCVPVFAYNPVLSGQYADPDIDYFDGKYWIYPTTDGKYWWTANVFHAFSSDDLINWTDEGVILDTNYDSQPSVNDKGVQICISPWSVGESAWAPSIEKKNDKYYLYYVARIRQDKLDDYGVFRGYKEETGEEIWWDRAIGVAVANNPAGPYVASEAPIAYPKLYASLIDNYTGEQIDPAIFTDDDGSSYLLTGGSCVAFIAKLNDDMTTVDTSTVREVKGMEDFLESFYIFKRNGLYHFTWSCYGTNGEDYTVKYATATSLDGELKNTRVLLTKDIENDLLCTAHQSFVYRADIDECLIAYHRFFLPLSNYPTGLGFHRETCIEKVEFDGITGLMKTVKPTMYGAGKIDASEYNVNLENDIFLYTGKNIEPAFTVTDKDGNTISSSCYTYVYKANRLPSNSAKLIITFNGNINGEIVKTFSIVKEMPTEPAPTEPTTQPTTQPITQPAQPTATPPQSQTVSTTAQSAAPTTAQQIAAPAQTTAKPAETTTAPSSSKPKKAAISKLTKGSKQFKVVWKKISGVTGYEIQYSTDKKFKKNVKSKKIKGASKTSLTVKKLKAKKTYYVRVRAYKTVKVNSKTKTVYGSWSAVKSVKTK